MLRARRRSVTLFPAVRVKCRSASSEIRAGLQRRRDDDEADCMCAGAYPWVAEGKGRRGWGFLPSSCGFFVPFRLPGTIRIRAGSHKSIRSNAGKRRQSSLQDKALPRAARNSGYLSTQYSGTMDGHRQDGTRSKRSAHAAQHSATPDCPNYGHENSGSPRLVQCAHSWCRTVLRCRSMSMETFDRGSVGPPCASSARRSIGTFRRWGGSSAHLARIIEIIWESL
jgi:hypothetical protein